MSKQSSISRRWLPNEKALLDQWHQIIHQEIQQKADTKRHMVIQEFAQLIDEDPIVRMCITQMIEQIPAKYKDYHPKNLADYLNALNAVLTIAPAYIPAGHGEASALVGTPFSAILIWTMGTPAGFEAYRNPKINAMFHKLLYVWTGFLNSSDSLYVFNESENGWMSTDAQNRLNMDDYIYQPDEPCWGFTSWNDFFTRAIKPEKRPIASPHDHKVIIAGCDSSIYRVSRNVQAQSEFWIKGQPYSLNDMLNHDYVEHFIGGDVWQAFLSPFNYHRWHSPIAGTIRKAYVKPGLYFAQAQSEGQDPTDQDHSEAYITHTQARAIFFIEADDPAIGLVCFMPVGMVEISSCIIDDKIKIGAHVEKGQELGYFQFGGSTHCVVFEPGVIKEFTADQVDEAVRFGQQIAIAN